MALQGIRRISSGVVQDLAINSGRPVIEGTRVFVDRIIGHLESGMSIVEICQEYEPGAGSVCEGLRRCTGKCCDEVKE
jgi:uncharacterized protein (DUF433 family)